MRYNWQHPDWPRFTYDVSVLQEKLLSYTALANQLVGSVSQLKKPLQSDALLDILMDEALKNAAIEGVMLQSEDVRSSLMNQLGLNSEIERVSDQRAANMARLTLLARENFDTDLTQSDLFLWQTLAVSGPRIDRIRIGAWRNSSNPMQIVSGAIGHEKVHYEATPSQQVAGEMNSFLTWFNNTHPHQGNEKINGVIRAGIAHLWFESIHPFDDGNGRVGRALTEKALAQDLRAPILYSLSGAIAQHRKAYYQGLQSNSGFNMEITPWLEYFMQTILEAQKNAEKTIRFVLAKAQYFQIHTAPLNPRQKKAIRRMFKSEYGHFEGGMSASKYENLTQCSKATATRDLSDLLEKGYLRKLEGAGRSTRYVLNINS